MLPRYHLRGQLDARVTTDADMTKHRPLKYTGPEQEKEMSKLFSRSPAWDNVSNTFPDKIFQCHWNVYLVVAPTCPMP